LRLLILAIMACQIFLHSPDVLAAEKAQLCHTAMSPSKFEQSASDALASLNLEDLDFPQHDAFLLLQERYRKTNLDIDRLLDQINKDMKSPAAKNTAELVKINEEIFAHIKKVQKLTEPGFVRKLVTSDVSAVKETAKLVGDITYCRSQGESCLVALREDISQLKDFHRTLRQNLEVLQNEIQELNTLAANLAGQLSLQKIVMEQSAALETTALIFKSQMLNHHQLIDAALAANATFENSFKNNMRSLLVDSRSNSLREQSFAKLHDDQNNSVFDPKVKAFPVGTPVSMINQAASQDFTDGGLITGWVKGGLLIFEGRHHSQNMRTGKVEVKNIKRMLEPDQIAIQGCHQDICSGDMVEFSGRIWTRNYYKSSYGSDVEPRILEKVMFHVVGHNPVLKSYLVSYSLESNQQLSWISEASLLAAKNGTLNSSGFYGDFPGDQSTPEIKLGDITISDAGVRFEVKSLTILNLNGPSSHLSRERLAKVGCFFGICSGRFLERKTAAGTQRQLVLGYSILHDAYLVDTSNSKMFDSIWFEESSLKWVKRSDMPSDPK
jgi:hypothetical protein